MITKGEHTYVMAVREIHEPIVEIGKFSALADGVVLMGNVQHPTINHPKAVSSFPFQGLWNIPYFEGADTRGKIVIGNDVWIGLEAVIMDGVTIGDGAIIGTRAVVTKDVPPYAVVVGNPATIKKFRFGQEHIDALRAIAWWNWQRGEIENRMEDFKDINVFVQKYL